MWWKHNPAGPEYNKRHIQPPFKGVSNTDYYQNFKEFLHARKEKQPFYFWVGSREPHRPYERIAGKKPIENWPMQKFLLFFPIRRP